MFRVGNCNTEGNEKNITLQNKYSFGSNQQDGHVSEMF